MDFVKIDQPIPMPRPVPRRIPMNNRARRSMIYYPSRPFISPNSLFDSTKAFKDGRVIYLSDFVVTKECVKITPIYMGRKFKKLGLSKTHIYIKILEIEFHNKLEY